MFIGEHESGVVTELESQDVNFLENEFPSIKKIDKDFQFNELEDANEIITYNVGVSSSMNPSRIATLSESQTSDTSIPIEKSIRKSSRKPIPRRHFEIEG